MGPRFILIFTGSLKILLQLGLYSHVCDIEVLNPTVKKILKTEQKYNYVTKTERQYKQTT